MAQSGEIEKLERRWMDNPTGLTFAPLAEAYRRAGDQPRALEILDLGLAQHPAYVPALIVQARCHLDAGLDAQAEASFLAVSQHDPHNLIALKGLAEIAELSERLEEAKGFLDRLLVADPSHAEAGIQRDRVMARLDDRSAILAAVVPEAPAASPAAVPEGFETTAASGDGAEVEGPLAEWSSTVEREGVATKEYGTHAGPDSPVAAAEGAEETDQPRAASLDPEAELVIEKFSSPFAGFDTGAWDLPFGDLAVPEHPFEESMTLDGAEEAVSEPLSGSATDTPGSLEAESAPGEPAAVFAAEELTQDGGDDSGAAPESPVATVTEGPALVVEPTPKGSLWSRLWSPAPGPGWVASPDEERESSTFALGEPASEAAPEPTGEPQLVPTLEQESEASSEAPIFQPESSGELESEPEAIFEVIDAAPGPQEGTAVEVEAVELTVPGAAADAPEDSDDEGRPWAFAAVREESVEPMVAEAEPEPILLEEDPEPIVDGEDPEPMVAENAEPAWGADTIQAESLRAAPEAATTLDEQVPVAADEVAEEMEDAVPADDATANMEEPVSVVDGAEAESVLDLVEPAPEEEPELVITETMAEVFLRQGHRPLALAVYAQLLERDPQNARILEAVARLRVELSGQSGRDTGTSASAPGVEEPVGSFLARVLGADLQAEAGPPAVALEPEVSGPFGGCPTRAAADPSLRLSTIFGEDLARQPSRTPGEGAADAEGEPSFDEFFGEDGRHGVPAGAGGDEAELEQFNAWLRSLQR